MENQDKSGHLDQSKSGLQPKQKKIFCLKIDTTPSEIEFRKICEKEDDFKTMLNYINCSICKTSLKNVQKQNIFKHPLLNVLLCKSCWKFYSSGEFSLDEDDEDKYCRWCGQGGKIFLCSKCICGFCPKCIKTQFGSKKVNEIKNEEDWKCFICNPEPLWKLRALCYYTMNPMETAETKKPINKSTPNAKEGKKTAEVEIPETQRCSRSKTKVLRDNPKRSIEIPSNEEKKLSSEVTQRKRRKCTAIEKSLITEIKDPIKRATRRTRNTSGTPELARKMSKSELPSTSPQSQTMRANETSKVSDKCIKDSSDSDSPVECTSDTESADESGPNNKSDRSLGSSGRKLQDILKITEVASEFSLKTCRKTLKKFSDANFKYSKENILAEVRSIKSIILLLSSSLTTSLNICNSLEEKLNTRCNRMEEHENDSVRTNQKIQDDTIDISTLLKMILEFMLKEKIKSVYLLEIIDDICKKYQNIGISSHTLFSNFLKSMMKKADVNVQPSLESDISLALNTNDGSGQDSGARCEGISMSHLMSIADKDKNETSESIENNEDEISKNPSGEGNASTNDAVNVAKESDDCGSGNIFNNDSEKISKVSVEKRSETASCSNAVEHASEEELDDNFFNQSENISKRHTAENVGIASTDDAEQTSKELNETTHENIPNNDSEGIPRKPNEEGGETVRSNVAGHTSKEAYKKTFGNVSNIDSEVISENSNENKSENPIHNDLEIISKDQNTNRYGTNSNNHLGVILRGPNENTLGNVFKTESEISNGVLNNKMGFSNFSSLENFCMISDRRCSGQCVRVLEEEIEDSSSITDTIDEENEDLSSDLDFNISEAAKIREELLRSESSSEIDLNVIELSSSDSSSAFSFEIRRPKYQKHKTGVKSTEKRKKRYRSNMSKEERELRKLLDLSSLERRRKVKSNSTSHSVDSNDDGCPSKITKKGSKSDAAENKANTTFNENMIEDHNDIHTFAKTFDSDKSQDDKGMNTEIVHLSNETDKSDGFLAVSRRDRDLNGNNFIQSDVGNANLNELDLPASSNYDIEYNKDEGDEASVAENTEEKDAKTSDAGNNTNNYKNGTSQMTFSSEASSSKQNSTHNSKYKFLKKKGNASWRNDKLLRKISEDSSSDEDSSKERKKKEVQREKLEKSVYDFSDSDFSIPEKRGGFRGRKPQDSDTSETSSSSSEVEIIPSVEQPPNKGRKNIKKILNQQSLDMETKHALKIENERKKRVAEKNEMYKKLFPNLDESDRLVLDFNPDTREVLLEVPKNLVKNLKPHQKQGVKFMWDCCFESVDKLADNKGTGCILAHCMGLGKTLQVITLIYTLLDFRAGIKTVLIVCPLNVLNNWLQEFVLWWRDCPRDFVIYSIQNNKKKIERYSKIKKWYTCGGVLILSYNMMRSLEKTVAKRMSKKKKYDFSYFLHDPGPDVVVCDEGHIMKNEDSGLSKCMRRIKTSRRIVLTGTPFQNNLLEYYSMIQFVKPNILGTKMEFMNRFVNPIKNGQFEDSTDTDVALMRARSHVLHKMLDGCIQRFDYNVAIPFLPEKQEYVISIQLTQTQAVLYRHYIEKCRQRSSLKNEGCRLFRDFTWLHKLWTHPLTLVSYTKNRLINDKFTDSMQNNDEPNFPVNVDANDDDFDAIDTNEKFWEAQIKPEEYEDYKSGGKLFVLLSLLKCCKDVGDKVLVFSQSLYVLNLIEHFLKKINRSYFEKTDDIPIHYRDTWMYGVDYYRLDGSTNSKTRSKFCKAFNKLHNKRGRLFLISTKAGGLGINLTGANRVVIFDVSWNPSYDVQSIFRVYRFGQKKPCYFYRFFAEGTMEEKIYERQVTKLSLEKRVLDEHQIERHYTERDIQELYKYDPVPQEKWVTPKLPRDVVLAKILNIHKDIIVGYHEHDSLLENKQEEELTEEERRAAWDDFESERFWKEAKIQKQCFQKADSQDGDNEMENNMVQDFWAIMSDYGTTFNPPEIIQLENYQYHPIQNSPMINFMLRQTESLQYQQPSTS